MSISDHKAFSMLERKMHKLWNAVDAANERYLEYPDRTIHRRATRATITNDLIFGEVVTAFDEVPDCKIVTDRKRNLRLLSIEESVLLWFKKVNAQRIPSNYLTEHAQDLLNGQQLEMMPKASILVVGYLLDRDEDHVKRLSFAPPSIHKPKWFFDVSRLAKVSSVPGPQRISDGNQLVVTWGAKQHILFS